MTWNEFYRRIAGCSTSGGSSSTCRSAVARAGARLTQAIPGAPLTTDQVTMLEAGDNTVSNDDAAAVFGLPLVGLDEQIRRAV